MLRSRDDDRALNTAAGYQNSLAGYELQTRYAFWFVNPCFPSLPGWRHSNIRPGGPNAHINLFITQMAPLPGGVPPKQAQCCQLLPAVTSKNGEPTVGGGGGERGGSIIIGHQAAGWLRMPAPRPLAGLSRLTEKGAASC